MWAAVAERQHGTIALWQLEAAGETRASVRHLVAARRLVRLRPGVYRVAGGAPTGRLVTLVAATLASRDRAVVTRRTAAVDLWGIPDISRTSAVELLVERPVDLSLPRVTLSTTDHLPAADRTMRFGVPVVTFPRLIVELGAVLPASALGPALDFGLRRRLLSLDGFVQCFERWHRPGRRGTGRIAAVLGERTTRYRIPDSAWEDDLYRRLVRAGLPPGERWYRVELPGGRLAWLDVAYPAAKVGIELDSFEWHGQRSHFDDDAEGRAALAALGWRIIPVTSRSRLDTTVTRVRTALGLRAAS